MARALPRTSMLAATCVLAGIACANGESSGRRDGGVFLDAPASDGGGIDARGATDVGGSADVPGLDAPGRDAPSTDAGSIDARAIDAGTDAGRTDSGLDAGSTSTLDLRLDTPPASAPPCSTPGASCSAGGPGVCRFFSATEGRCESCSSCGNLNAPCSDGTECDILFACFAGRCTNICPLGTFFCGPVEDCLDVGHPTHGVCRP